MTSTRLARVAAAAVVLASLLSARLAAADPAPSPPPRLPDDEILHVKLEARLVGKSGEIILPPGWYLPEPRWQQLDAEHRRLQDVETRLAAENRSLKADVDSGLPPGLTWLLGAASVGFAAGLAVGLSL